MKKILFLASIILCCHFVVVLSQDAIFNCLNDSSHTYPLPVSYLKSAYIPDENTPIIYIKVNFHFLLKNTGSPDCFTETDDGNGNSNFTGYDYAKNAVYQMNENYLGNNRQMNLPPNNNTEVLPMRIRLVLQGVYFHRSDTYHYYENVYGTLLNNLYGVEDACNIYLVGSNDNPVNNIAGYGRLSEGWRYIVIKNIWYFYESDPDPLYGINGIIHELFHNFGLEHTLLTAGGICCTGANPPQIPYCDDACDDTPTWEYIVETLNEDDPCCWNAPECSNNIMDYTANREALTPCQLGIAHEVIEDIMEDYMLRSHTSNITICDIGYPIVTHIGKNVTISGATCSPQPVKIEDDEGIEILFNESVTIESQFEIELGGELTIDTYEII